jgi:hypothetical protein
MIYVRSTTINYRERRRFLWILFLGGLAVLALAVALSATTLSRLRFTEPAQESTAVARLRCLSAVSRWDKGEIWTETRFEVLETEKGLLPGPVTVRMLGGHVEHLHARVDGVPIFRPSEEAYLFLWGRAGEPYAVLGWSQGTFRIAKNPQTGLETVTQDSAAMPVFDPQTQQFRREGIRNWPVGIIPRKVARRSGSKALVGTGGTRCMPKHKKLSPPRSRRFMAYGPRQSDRRMPSMKSFPMYGNSRQYRADRRAR